MNNIPEQIIEKIKRDQIVVFAGAGVSMKAGLPDWNKLIETILDNLGSREPKSQKFKAALRDELFTPIEILSKISHLKEDVINLFFQEMKKYEKCEPTSIHKKLGELSDKIITTNYDELFEKALDGREKVIYTNTFKLAKLSEFEKYIFKIHGDINEPDRCILFPEEYEKQYASVEKSSVFELKKIISDKSILFIGFSLSDPYINYIFDYVSSLYSGFNPEHFIITTQKDKTWPSKITPIVIENRDEIEEVIDHLIKVKQDQNIKKQEIAEDLNVDLTESQIKFSRGSEIDSPPNSKYWVGRNQELKNIYNKDFRVVFITGIGGQGKSALAAHFIRNHFDSTHYEFADWRDFKEETNRFQTKLLSIIKRLEPTESNIHYENIRNEELIDYFFKLLADRKIIFVFDNIDSYIDLETFKPVGSMGYFFEQALNNEHNSKFIFTCRPFIREAGINFYQLSLKGILEEECNNLFQQYNIPINEEEIKKLSLRAHKLTKGHPLWLNLIAGQANRGLETVNDFILKIENKTSFDEDDFSAILSEKILTEVWNSLNDKQKTLIRGIAETVKPEKEENLKSILDSELNNNQFNKALRVLRNLNLVESLSEGEIELHPLVKEFVLSKYPKTERAKFITLLIQYYDQFIYIIKPRLNSNLTISEFQNWTSKIELQINKSDFKAALISLEEVSMSLLTAGYSEEYLRVAELLFSSLDWSEAISKEYPYFHNQILELTTCQSQLGKFDICDENLAKYSKLIPGKSSYYLGYCSQKVYNFWYQKKYNEAIQIAEEGIFLLDESNLADNYSLKHNYALSLRDSGVNSNIRKALEFFLKNESIDEVLNPEKFNKDLHGSYYGNIGKCLELLDKDKDALYCYCLSFKLLIKENAINTKLNLGYASKWISHLLLSKGKISEGLHFLRLAINCWSTTSPPLNIELYALWDKINFDKVSKKSISELKDWNLENFCKTFVTNQLL